jgi:CRP/FNR family transcriptional regulator, cyclic AMP receptor protein
VAQSNPVFWERLTDGERAALWRAGTVRCYPSGEALIRQGEATSHLVVLLAGSVRLVVTTRDGRQTILALRRTGEVVGEQAGLCGDQREATVVAAEATRGLVVTWQAFLTLMREWPRITHLMLEIVSSRLREADTVRAMFGGEVAARLALVILDLAERFGRRSRDGLEVHTVSQDDLGMLVGASRETVSRALSELRCAGAVRTGRRRIVVTDLAALRVAAGTAGL